MPTYDREQMLPKSISSVLMQDYKNLELLVIDDGSTDNTQNVIKQLQADDDRIRYIKLTENHGIGFARDTGIRNATGKYIGFADSDDLWLTGKLYPQVKILEEYTEIDFLFADFLNIDLIRGITATGFSLAREGMQNLVSRSLEENLWLVESGFERALLIKNFIQLGTVLFQSKLIDNIGSFNTALSGPEDFEFCWRAAVYGCCYAYERQSVVERNINSSSVTANKITSWQKKLIALEICRQTSQDIQRLDLLPSIHSSEQRAWRNLIWAYGNSGRRSKALQAYRDTLRLGFSARTSIYAITALIGPRAITLAKKIMSVKKNLRGDI